MFNRRSFLRKSMLGAGALSLAPLAHISAADLPAMGQIPKRFIFVRKSNGLFPHWLTPPSFSQVQKDTDSKREALEESLAKHELQDWMKILDPYKDRMAILQGISSKMSENGHHSFQSVMGAYNSSKGTLSQIKRATVDFELAKLFPSPFGHIEFSFADTRTGIVPGFSAPAPYQRNSCYADPITAYNDLFKCVINPSLLHSDSKMLQQLSTDELEFPASLNEIDKNSIKNHVSSLDLIYARNKKLEKMAPLIAKHMPDFEKIQEFGAETASMPQREEAMTDVLVASLVSGLTNAVVYTVDDLKTQYTGVPGGYENKVINLHSVGHNCEGSDDIRRQIDMMHLTQIKTIIEALKAQPEGNGNMFDNTMIMYFAEGGDRHHGNGDQLPIVMLMGKNIILNIAGKYIRLPYHATEGHKTLGNWYTTLLNAHGNPIHHYGDPDSAMAVLKMPQEGAIKGFIKS